MHEAETSAAASLRSADAHHSPSTPCAEHGQEALQRVGPFGALLQVRGRLRLE